MQPESNTRIVPSVHGKRRVEYSPATSAMTAWLRAEYSREALVDLYGRYQVGDDKMSTMMRAAIWGAGATRAGDGLRVGGGAGFLHLETFEIGEGVFIGAQAFVQ